MLESKTSAYGYAEANTKIDGIATVPIWASVEATSSYDPLFHYRKSSWTRVARQGSLS